SSRTAPGQPQGAADLSGVRSRGGALLPIDPFLCVGVCGQRLYELAGHMGASGDGWSVVLHIPQAARAMADGVAVSLTKMEGGVHGMEDDPVAAGGRGRGASYALRSAHGG